jgi:hypothetical protein
VTPNAEQVAVAWIVALGLGGQLFDLIRGVSNTLPLDWATVVDPRLFSVLAAPGPVYVQVTVPGGIVDRYAPIHRPHVQVDAWAAEGLLAEVAAASDAIRDATYDGFGIGLVTANPNFSPVLLTDVSTFTEPRQIRGDPAALARSSQILVFTYTVKE